MYDVSCPTSTLVLDVTVLKTLKGCSVSAGRFLQNEMPVRVGDSSSKYHEETSQAALRECIWE